jgi:hypothetical protein
MTGSFKIELRSGAMELLAMTSFREMSELLSEPQLIIWGCAKMLLM